MTGSDVQPANDGPFWTATEALTWLAFGKPERWDEFSRRDLNFFRRWSFRPPTDVLRLLEAVSKPARFYPWLPTMAEDRRKVVGYVTDYAAPSRWIEASHGRFKLGGPELARAVRKEHRARLGRMISYDELAALLRADLAQHRQRQAKWNEACRTLRDAIGRGQITARGVPASDRERLHLSLPREIAVLAIQFRNDVIEPDGTATDAEVAAIRASAHFVRVRFDTAEIRALCPQKFADQGAPARGNPQPFPDAEHIAPWVAVSWRAFKTLEAPSHIVGHRSFDHGDSRLPDEEQASYDARQAEHLVFDAAEREVMNLLAGGHIKALGQLPARAASGKRLHLPGPAHTEIPSSTFLNQQLAFDAHGELITRRPTFERLFPSLELRGSDADPGFAFYHDVLMETEQLRKLWQPLSAPATDRKILDWLTNTAEAFLREKKAKPKQADLVRDCVHELDCRYEDAETAFRQMPTHLRRSRGERDKPGKSAR